MEIIHYDSQFSIACCRFARQLYPWTRSNVLTPHWRFYWNPTPGAELIYGGRTIPISPDCFYILPRGLVFSHNARNPFDHFYLHFSVNSNLRPPDRIFELPAEPGITSDIRALVKIDPKYENFLKYTFSAYSVLSRVMLMLPDEVISLSRPMDERIQFVCDYVSHHLDSPMNNRLLASLCKLESCGFSRLFKAETGEAPQFFIARKRIERACELFYAEKYSIEEIAQMTGFSNRYYFSRVFRKLLHVSPAAWYRDARMRYGCVN